MEASCWVARKIFLSPAMASSRARTLDSRPTTKGVIMYGNMTTSRIGIIGRRLVSDLSREVSIVFGSRGDLQRLHRVPPGRDVFRQQRWEARLLIYCMTLPLCDFAPCGDFDIPAGYRSRGS